MRARLIQLVVSLTLAASLAACTAATDAPAVDSTDVPFASCAEVACTGTLDGANYEIVMPTTWNGTLLLYSHGYRAAQPVPPDFAPVLTTAEPAPGWSEGSKDVGNELLAQGYALAGSSYATNGWALADGVRAGEDLYSFFRDNVAAPARVYAWGDSLGGLVTAQLAEAHPDWVSGSAPLCAPLAGLAPNMDLALDVAYAVRELIWKDFKVTGYTSYEQAIKQFQGAAERIVKAAGDVAGGGTAKVLFIAAIVDAPLATKTYDGSSTESLVKAAVEGILTALGYGTYGRYDIEQRLGGDPSDNTRTEYADRVTVADKQRIDAITPGATARYALQLVQGTRIAADTTARAKAGENGDPKGNAVNPMITLHTVADPLVIVQNQSWYLARAGADSGSRLVQLVTVPPATFAESTGAPYGAGHCNFTPESRVGLVRVLDDWVRGGTFPGAVSVTKAFGEGSGFLPNFALPAWPLGGVQPVR